METVEASHLKIMDVSPNRNTPSPNDHGLQAEILKNDLLLHEAVIKNDPEEVMNILREPCDVNSRNNYGRAPIHWAACRGNTDLIQMLVNAKCDIEARDKYGMRPLLMAAWHGHYEAVKLLLDLGACVKSVNKQQQTLLMCAARNRRARPEVVEVVLVALGVAVPAALEARDSEGHTALQHAATAGHARLVRRLARAGAALLTFDNLQRTPMHLASEQGHQEVVSTLLQFAGESGENVSVMLDARDKEGDTPLHTAAQNRQTEIVRFLLASGCDPASENSKGLTALHIASNLGSRGIIDCLLQAGASINQPTRDGSTPLHIACQTNNLDIVEYFIAKGADLNKLNMRMESAMHVAAARGDAGACRALLAAGAGTGGDEDGGSPLLAAARGSFTAIVDMIIKTARLDYPQENEENITVKGSGSTVKPILSAARRKWRTSQEDLSQTNGNDHMKEILWKLAHRHLGKDEWKKLAFHWSFTEEQIKAIEHQYTGPSSYKEHGYRMLLIWHHSLPAEVNTMKELSEGLLAIGRKNIGETLKKLQNQSNGSKPSGCNCISCSIT